MQVVWVPHPGLLEVYQGREKEVLAGLTGEHKDDEPNGNEEQVEVRQGVKVRVKGAPGEIDDGWGRQLPSLEDFPYEAYGIKIASASGL
jgi:pseudouridine 5'-phosphatase